MKFSKFKRSFETIKIYARRTTFIIASSANVYARTKGARDPCTRVKRRPRLGARVRVALRLGLQHYVRNMSAIFARLSKIRFEYVTYVVNGK